MSLSAACGGNEGGANASTGTAVPGSRLTIASAGVDAELSTSVVPSSGVMPSPVGDEVYLYDWSQLPGFGGAPGQGNTVVGGRRASVFRELDAVKPGDVIDLTWNGRPIGYSVSSACFWDSRRGPFESVVAHTADETLTVLTSYGPAGNVELGRLVITAKPRTLVIASSDCPAGLQPLSSLDFEPAR